MAPLAMKIAARNFQLTDIKFSLHNDPKIKAGKQKVPTKVPIPLDSEADTRLNLKNKNLVTIFLSLSDHTYTILKPDENILRPFLSQFRTILKHFLTIRRKILLDILDNQ